ncbi:hypothetical protein CAPTEDRAFT_206888 [Capitella teleta]|uniref:Uncharacterized protein n=1 Tax=Capitella teleta TaxID=283909 RepID=R7UGB1_CAPTE|nr:hypothetical protein CAPTEDRAFT_206888 [Capitella teleta]|eukprot:ELU05260.1 hypothetical protein CAPTEDRAFT_206888 [Capitella teleta]
MKIVFKNVRRIRGLQKQQGLLTELERLKFDVCGLTETALEGEEYLVNRFISRAFEIAESLKHSRPCHIMTYMRTRLAGISLGLYLFTLALFLTGFAAAYWVTDNFGGDYHYGLWQYCAYNYDTKGDDCKYLIEFDAHDYFRAAEAFMVMSLMCSVPAGVIICIWIKKSDQRRLGLLSSGLNAIAGCLAIIGLIIFGAEFKRRGSKIHPNGWAFWISVMSSALLLLQGIIWTVIIMIPSLGFHYVKEHQEQERRNNTP